MDYVIVDRLWLASLQDSLRSATGMPHGEAVAQIRGVVLDIDLLLAQADATERELAMMGVPLSPRRRVRAA